MPPFSLGRTLVQKNAGANRRAGLLALEEIETGISAIHSELALATRNRVGACPASAPRLCRSSGRIEEVVEPDILADCEGRKRF